MSTTAPQDAQLVPGVTVDVRDEQWLVTGVASTTDGFRVRVRGVSDYVRDTTATFFTALDDINVVDPTKVTVKPDTTPHYRRARLWVESVLRQTPVPLYQQELEVSGRILADPLDYQMAAVHKALSPVNPRPRILLADAVGLGKTLEIGMILAELIRRGRGERILVITPKHVMEQFQQEMWTRFAIPLVRLDSVGIQKVRQKLPASRNPFTYFPRVIVSMDTLKSPKYLAQLHKVHWDAVVIDEIHNATNAGTQNNRLARTIAPTTDALVLASATPHNGDDSSFKEILRLLDPLSVMPDGTIDTEAAKRLIIRRHRQSPEVSKVVGSQWAERAEPQHIPVSASDEEAAVARELHERWLGGTANTGRISDHLFPWMLVKAFLSSPAALSETIKGRLSRIPKTANTGPERQALEDLAELAAAITPETSEKYNALVNYLQEIGVSKGSDTRVVVFSERVSTLRWLQENLTKHMKLPKGAVKIMHGGLSDTEQMALIDEFKRTDSPLRVLVTGDVASEGVNLHAQCHHLVHYDIPWSLIRIQQRNGRIDRYGQRHSPQITTLLLDPGPGNTIGELHVLKKLVDREQEAYRVLGDAAPLMGKNNIRGEEDEIRKVLEGARDFDDAVATATQVEQGAHAVIEESGDGEAEPATTTDITSLLAALSTQGTSATDTMDHPATATADVDNLPDSTYPSELDYLRDALDEAFPAPHQGTPKGVSWVEHDNAIAELTPPEDLRRRFDYLPQDYVADRRVKDRLMLATSRKRGDQQLEAAKSGDSSTSWPKAHFLGPLHPVSQWASDRALSGMDRSIIPAVTGTVTTPTVFLLGTLTNEHGQVVSRAFMTATEGPLGLTAGGAAAASVTAIDDPVTWLAQAGLSAKSINDGATVVPEQIEALMKAAVAGAASAMAFTFDAADDEAERRSREWSERAEAWHHGGQQTLSRELGVSKEVLRQEKVLMNSMAPRRSLVRPVLVIVPESTTDRTEA